MSARDSLPAQRVHDLVMANRAIRAPEHRADQKGIGWGADVIPALLDLFRVEKDLRDDRPDRWVGFAAFPEGYRPRYARDWRGEALRLDFDVTCGPGEADPILVVTAIAGREGTSAKGTVTDEDFGEIELPDPRPTLQEWEERGRRYQAVRNADADDGAAAVKAYAAALPGWKGDAAKRFDEIIRREVPHVRSAVRWHIPFYGVESRGWFASFSAFSKHVTLGFVCNAYLEPVPPVEKGPEGQALDLKKSDALDEEQVAAWLRQAATEPGMSW